MSFVPVFSDNFNTTDGNLDSKTGWQLHNTGATSGRWAVNGNVITASTAAGRRSCQVTADNVFSATQYAQAKVNHGGTAVAVDIGLGLCFQAQGVTENHYRFIMTGDTGSTDVTYRIAKFVAGTNTTIVSSSAVARPATGFTFRARRTSDGYLHIDVNGSNVLSTTSADASFTGGQPGVYAFTGASAGGWSLDDFVSGDIVDDEPGINPTGTDTDLVNGTSSDIVFQNLTSDPESITVIYDDGVADPISSVQDDFVMGTITDGAGTATFTDTIGNLPYSDGVTYLAANYSYLVTCADASELTLDALTFAPAADRSFVVAVDPVSDETGIMYQWEEGGAVTGDQVDYETAAVTVREDFTFFGPAGETDVTLNINYWDSVSQIRYAVSVIVSFDESGEGTVTGITERGFTQTGFTEQGFTRRGF